MRLHARPHPTGRAPAPRSAITLVFFVNGALFASWASRIPALADRAGATTGVLGVALLAPALGAIIAMPLVGRLLPGRSSRPFCRIAVAGLMAAILLPATARSVPALAGALLLVGVANSTLDLVMNAQGVSVERHLGRPILSSLHAAFSFGGFAGAGLGALAAALHLAPLPHLAFAALVFGVPGLLATGRLLAHDEDADAHAPALRLKRIPPRLALLGGACFFCLMAEGGASDWSAKLVRDDLAGTAALGAVAYAVFSVAMGLGRLIADRLWARWGSVGLLRRSGALAALGFAAGLVPGTVPAAVAGFAALGLGLAGVVPTLFRAGADEPGVSTGPALAAVSSLGYAGFLAGPPVIGGVAQLTSLRLACALLALAGLLVLLLAPRAAPPARARPCSAPAAEQAELRA
ncbi:MAG TPA: MFS transporter [Solirubrobacteraceae bacterium]|nr:MFS transporter [Solirubrobacteraceae bacterium]